MQILELLFLINGLKKCKWTSLCTWYVIFALFTHIFYISKTDKILPFFSQLSSKFLQHFWGNRFTCMLSPWISTSFHNIQTVSCTPSPFIATQKCHISQKFYEIKNANPFFQTPRWKQPKEDACFSKEVIPIWMTYFDPILTSEGTWTKKKIVNLHCSSFQAQTFSDVNRYVWKGAIIIYEVTIYATSFGPGVVGLIP